MLRCTASRVTAANEKVGLIPQDLHALPLTSLRSRLKYERCYVYERMELNDFITRG